MSHSYTVRRADDEPFEADELRALVHDDPELRWGRGGIEWRAADAEFACDWKERPGDPDAVISAGPKLECRGPCGSAIGKLAQIARALAAGLFHEEEPGDDIALEMLESYPPGVEAERAREEARKAERERVRARAPRPYTPKGVFDEGERIAHEKFGTGVVTAAEPTKIVVDFAGTVKKLAHRMA